MNNSTCVQKRTFCRVCEPACGLVATVEDGELVKLMPDREHPITRGFACHKGIAGLDIHRDPDRVNYPLRRNQQGGFDRIGWSEAISEIGQRLRGIVDESGARAVSAYVGNPSGFNALARPAMNRFLSQLGVAETFGSGTQDCANKFAGSEAVFGSSTIHPIPDLERTDYLLILGENPAVSHMSFLGIADPMKVLRRAKKRGATIRFVDPRKIESAVSSVGDVIQIRPDTDLYFLASVLCEIDRTVGFDSSAVEQHGRRVEELRAFVRNFPPERVEKVTGVSAELIREVALGFAQAESAAVHMSTGINMGRQGTLCYWLLHMLSFVTGNFDSAGGNILSEGFYLNAKAGRANFSDNVQESDWGTLRSGALPGNLLAERVLDPSKRVRAMFVMAGNPVLSIAGEEKLRDAFESLDLLVCVDIYRNATGELADYVLPATDMFERQDITLTGLGMQHEPYVQWTDRMVEAYGERREEWWIFARLAQEMGLESPLDAEPEDQEALLWGKFDHMLRTTGESLDSVKSSAHGITYGPHAPGKFFERHIQTADQRIDCCPEPFAAALERSFDLFRELEEMGPETLVMITRRDKYMHNSWYANIESMKPKHNNRTFVYLHPSDATRLELVEGQTAEVWNDFGKIEAEVRLDEDLMQGVLAIPHGWGNKRTPGMRVAQRTAGANVNRLLPSGPGSFEPLSSQSHMTGIPVRVAAQEQART